jgi:tetratricopeptide (TPR) repeat protein
MSIDVALRNNWFSQLTWVVPTLDQLVAPDLEAIRNLLFENAMTSEEEATSFIKDKQLTKGTLRNTPLSISNMSGLVAPDVPIILHIDLSYLQGLYKNEIATPTLQTIYSTLAALKEHNINTLAVTFAYGHLDNQIALDVRFIGEIIEQLIANPALLKEQPLPNWKRQADAIYLVNFFQGEKVDEIHRAQEQDDPDSAWVKFNLYRSSATLKQGEQALDYLAQAVALDPMYAYEYGNLARMAYDRRRPDETMRMYTLAGKALPEDHLIKLSMAELAAELGNHEMAKHLLDQLKDLPWSPPYHGEMNNYLDGLSNRLEINTKSESEESK